MDNDDNDNDDNNDDKDNDDDNDNATEGGNRLNRTVARQRYSRPCDRHPVCGPGVVHVKASAWIRAGVRSRMMTGREEEGGGEVGNMMGGAYSLTKTNTMAWRMGRGRAGGWTMRGNPTTTVATSSAGRPSVAWGIGRRSSAPTLPPPSSMTMTMMTIAVAVGGASCPPLRSVPSFRTPLVVVDVADRG
jgi:hypothetical protein